MVDTDQLGTIAEAFTYGWNRFKQHPWRCCWAVLGVLVLMTIINVLLYQCSRFCDKSLIGLIFTLVLCLVRLFIDSWIDSGWIRIFLRMARNSDVSPIDLFKTKLAAIKFLAAQLVLLPAVFAL